MITHRTTAVTVLLVGALAGCSSGGGSAAKSTSAAPLQVNGTVALHDTKSVLAALLTGGTACSGQGGYSDLAQGAEVVISDDAGATLSIAHLGPGVAQKPATGASDECDFTFTSSVPAGKKFYGVQVTHRGVVKMSEADIPNAKLTIGP